MKGLLKPLLGVAVLLLVYAALWPRHAMTEEERRAVDEGRTVIVYWDRHSGHEHEARRVLVDEFNRSQDKIFLRALSVGYDASMEKWLTAVAGNNPPDICGLDGNMMMQLATQGCFIPIEDLMAEAPGLSQEDFYPHCWENAAFNGHVWGIPTTTDSYCLIWNKDLFRKAGLDPERPPATMKELEENAAKLTIYEDGAYKQVGFLPWQPWDQTLMWGLLFGGRWYDPRSKRVTCAEEESLARMYEWQQSFARNTEPGQRAAYAMDPTRLLSFQGGFGAYISTNNAFYAGKLAMISEGEWQATFIPKYAPNLDWGVAPLPTVEGCEPLSFGGPSVVDCIPRGCKHVEAAWAFLKWFYSPREDGRPSPASDYDYAIQNIPCRIADAHQERFLKNPKFKVFVDVLSTRKVVWLPVTPLSQYFVDEMERHREQVVFGGQSPMDALREIRDKTESAFDNARRVMGGGS